MEDQAPRLGMTHRHDAEEVLELAFEATGRERDAGEGRHAGVGTIDGELEFDPGVGRAGCEEVHDPQLVPVVVARDEGEPHALRQKGRGRLYQLGCLHHAGTTMPTDRLEPHGAV